jgi:hypothetical protein
MEAAAPPPVSWLIAFAKSNPWPVWFFLGYAALFGVRIGPKEAPWFQIHGAVNSLWLLAQNVGVGVERIGRIETKLDKALNLEQVQPSATPATVAPSK